MSLTELADRVGVTIANLSILKTGKARADALLDARRALPRTRLPAGRPVATSPGRVRRKTSRKTAYGGA